jgi:3-hydroxyacyl-CoA dehydrogenase
LFIEAVAEHLAVKRTLFAKLEAFAQPKAIIPTNASTLSVTAIAAGLPLSRYSLWSDNVAASSRKT